jgi:hypothetical protein
MFGCIVNNLFFFKALSGVRFGYLQQFNQNKLVGFVQDSFQIETNRVFLKKKCSETNPRYGQFEAFIRKDSGFANLDF